MNLIETITYIAVGITSFLLIIVVTLTVLPLNGRDGPPECAKGGCEAAISMDDAGACFNPYKFDECGGVFPVLYLYVIVVISVPMLLILFKPIESILLLLIAFGIGFYLHDKKKAHD